MNTTVNIAVDPGKNGGAAVEWPNMAVEFIRSSEHIHEVYNALHQLAERIKHGGFRARAIIENVRAFGRSMRPCPKCRQIIPYPQGSKSIWTFAQNVAVWEVSMYALGIGFEKVEPVTWQKKACGTLPRDKKERKDKIKLLASQQFPQMRATLVNADALMMLVYMRKQPEFEFTQPLEETAREIPRLF